MASRYSCIQDLEDRQRRHHHYVRPLKEKKLEKNSVKLHAKEWNKNLCKNLSKLSLPINDEIYAVSTKLVVDSLFAFPFPAAIVILISFPQSSFSSSTIYNMRRTGNRKC